MAGSQSSGGFGGPVILGRTAVGRLPEQVLHVSGVVPRIKQIPEGTRADRSRSVPMVLTSAPGVRRLSGKRK